MKRWLAIGILGSALMGVTAGEGRLSKEDAQRYAKLCVEQASGKSASGKLRTDVDPDKALAVQGEGGGAMAIPDRGLSADRLAKVGTETLPIGQLWLRKWTLVLDDKPVPEKSLRIVKINIDDKKRPMPLFLLGVRKNADKAMELVVYAKGNEPLAVLPLKQIDFIPEEPLELEWARGEQQVDPLTMKILGKYQAAFAITRTGK